MKLGDATLAIGQRWWLFEPDDNARQAGDFRPVKPREMLIRRYLGRVSFVTDGRACITYPHEHVEVFETEEDANAGWRAAVTDWVARRRVEEANLLDQAGLPPPA